MKQHFLLEATVKRSMFGHVTAGDKVLVIKVKGALFAAGDTESEERKNIRLKEPKYYLCQSIDEEGYVTDWTQYIYVIDKENLEFINHQ
tara:strand:- start:4924 stop:5190 length:267 start_codon:yes stop_codon:yes gene_type:complete